MAFLAKQLRHRVQIRQATQTPTDWGGFERGYTTLATIWGGVKELSGRSADFITMIRGEQVNEGLSTHEFTFRKQAVINLGRAFAIAFDSDFDEIADLSQLKSDFFLFLESGSSVKGRLFKIRSIKRDDDHSEFIKAMAEEVEEQGTGYPE